MTCPALNAAASSYRRMRLSRIWLLSRRRTVAGSKMHCHTLSKRRSIRHFRPSCMKKPNNKCYVVNNDNTLSFQGNNSFTMKNAKECKRFIQSKTNEKVRDNSSKILKKYHIKYTDKASIVVTSSNLLKIKVDKNLNEIFESKKILKNIIKQMQFVQECENFESFLNNENIFYPN